MPKNKKGIEVGTPAEQREVKRRLRKRYGANWVADLKGKVKATLAKQKKTTARTTAVSSSLGKAGLSKEEIAKLRGKK